MITKVCIVGAGPGGLLLGKELSSNGIDVTILEKLEKEEYDNKYDWTDAVELSMLQDAGLPVPFGKGDRWYGYGVIGDDTGLDLYQSRRVTELGLYSPDYSCHTVTDADFRFVLADRTVLEAYQLKQTLEAGAKVLYGCTAKGLIGKHIDGTLGEIQVEGVVFEQGGQEQEIRADVIVDASGQSAALRTLLTGAPELSEPFDENQYGLVYKTHRKCENTQVVATDADWDHPPMRNHYRLRSPEGYIFLHPHDDHQFDIGGGAVTIEKAKQDVDDIIEKIPGVTEKKYGEAVSRNVKALPPNAIVAGGFMVIGHAASQIHPTHGCGISTAYMGALLAAQVLKRAKDASIETLWEYAHRWMSTQGAHFAALFYRLKNFEAEEVTLLVEHNIINGDTMTNDYHGNYMPLDVNEQRRLEDMYTDMPELVTKWLQLESQSNQNFMHYQDYPSVWNEYLLAKWCSTKPC